MGNEKIYVIKQQVFIQNSLNIKRYKLEIIVSARYYLKSVRGATVQRRRFPFDDKRVDGLRQENRQGTASDEIGIARYSRGLVVAVIIIFDRITLLVIFLRVILLLRTWRAQRSARLSPFCASGKNR